MTRAAFAAALVALLAPQMPEACNKMTGKRGHAKEDPPPPTVTSATTAAPTVIPTTTLTAPPIYQPPEAPAVDAGPGPDVNPELPQVKAAAEKKDWKKVKGMLERRIKAGRAQPDEVELMLTACSELKDKSCIDHLRTHYPARFN